MKEKKTNMSQNNKLYVGNLAFATDDASSRRSSSPSETWRARRS